jgi:hypothetical protein
MLKAVYDSAIQDELGSGLQIKGKDELIGKDGFFRKPGTRTAQNNIANSLSEDGQFFETTDSLTPSSEYV